MDDFESKLRDALAPSSHAAAPATPALAPTLSDSLARPHPGMIREIPLDPAPPSKS
jgi:hypothetical protein